MNFARGQLAQGGMLQTAAGFAAPVLQGAGGLMANLYGPVAGVFGSLFSGAAPVLAAVSAVTAAVMLLTDHLQDVRGLVERVFGARGAQVFDTMVGAVGAVKDKIVQTFSRENLAQVQGNLNLAFGPQVSGAFGALVQVFEGVRSVMGRVAEFAANTVKPLFEQVFGWMAGVAAPKLLAVFEACAPYIGELIANAGGLVMDGLQMIGTAIEAVLPVIGWLAGKFLDLAAVVGPAILQALAVFTGENGLGAVFAGLQKVLGGVIDFVAGVFTANWEQAWNGVRSIFGGIFESLAGLVKAPLNAVISLVNRAIAGINSIKIPQWARGFAGGAENLDLPQIPMLAKGGFTAGPSLAGEAGTEAVISFDRRVRGRNLQTWAAAGRLLGADGGWTPGGLAAGGGAQKVEVQFAPNITITGNASREDVSAAMNEAYEQFVAFMKRYERTKVRVAF